MLLTSALLSTHIKPAYAFITTRAIVRMSSLSAAATPASSDSAETAEDPMKAPITNELSDSIKSSYFAIINALPDGVKLVPVSKTKPASYLLPLLELEEGEREGLVFGENYMQELIR